MDAVFDYSRLRGKIKEVCDTQDEFSRQMHIGRVSLSKRLNNKGYFSQDEILKACDILGIVHSSIPAYFFAEKV